jgi:hypothetical protein
MTAARNGHEHLLRMCGLDVARDQGTLSASEFEALKANTLAEH